MSKSPAVVTSRGVSPGVGDNPAKLVLRRSFMGSLRSGSSFNRAPTSSPLSSENGQTPRKSVKHTNLVSATGDPFEMPEFERSVDLACVGEEHQASRAQVFTECLPQDETIYRNHPLFHLPAEIRLRIYDCCFPTEYRKLSLSPSFATKAVFGASELAFPFDVQEHVVGGLESFRALRYDLITYYWTHYHFHVTISPLTGPLFSPLSQVWLVQYLPIVQHLTVEIDLTMFGNGIFIGASQYGNNVEKLDNMADGVLAGISSRRDTTTMAELNLLCRRYAGYRPPENLSSHENLMQGASDFIPYCPELTTLLCDGLSDMRGLLNRCRIAGFTQNYTERLLQSVFHNTDNAVKWFTPSDAPWPREVQSQNVPGFQSAVTPASRLTCPTFKSSLTLHTPSSLSSLRSKLSAATSTPTPPTNRHTILVETHGAHSPQSPNSPGTLSFPFGTVQISTTYASSNVTGSWKSTPYTSFNSTCPSTPATPVTLTLPFNASYTDSSIISPKLSLKLTRSRSFQDEIKEQMRKSRYNVSFREGSNFGPCYKETKQMISDTLESFNEHSSENDEMNNTMRELEDEPSTKRNGNEKMEATPPLLEFDNDRPDILAHLPFAATSRIFDNNPLGLWIPPNNMISKASLGGHEIGDIPRCRTPTRPCLDTMQKSPNTMNSINERDPAFVKTMLAMRSVTEPRKAATVSPRSMSFQNVPKSPATQGGGLERCVTSLNNRSSSTRKRYLTFINKIRGRST